MVGVLPTYGRVSRYGLIAFASSLDRVGPFTANVKDAATMLAVLAGKDALDATSADRPVDDYVGALAKPVAGLRVGVPEEYFGEGLDDEIRAAVEKTLDGLKAAGCELVKISLAHTKYAIPTYYVLATAEASSNLSRFDGVRFGPRSAESKTLSAMYRKTREEGFGPEVKRRILLGTYALSAGYYDAYYRKAQQVRALLARDFLEAFADCDVIVGPMTPTPASSWARRWTIRWRCTWAISIRSRRVSRASAGCRCRAGRRRMGCRSAYRLWDGTLMRLRCYGSGWRLSRCRRASERGRFGRGSEGSA